MTAPSGDRLAQRAVAAPAYAAEAAEASDAIEPFLARWEQLLGDNASPFHSVAWLRAWYATLGRSAGRHPLLITVRDQASGEPAMLLPLVSRRTGGLSVVEFADGNVVDYVEPLLAPGWHGNAAQLPAAKALWAAVRKALRGHDLLYLHKMLPQSLDEAGAARNPLMDALPVLRSDMFGNHFSVAGDWEVWRRSLDKRVRKEIERSWRVFQRSESARFQRVTDPACALVLFETLERQQSERMRQAGVRYVLDEPEYRAFHRELLATALADGSVVLTVLLDGDQVVSALFGVANRQRYIGLRQSIGGDAWRQCSPGRLLDEQTARHMHEQGLVHFDFGIGDYFHKDAFRMVHVPLYDASVALSWRGVPRCTAWRTKHWIKRQDWLKSWVKRWRNWRAGAAASTPSSAT